MATFEQLNKAGLQAIGDNPQWEDQDTDTGGNPDPTQYDGAPKSAQAGVFLVANTSAAGVWVSMREDVHRRTARVVVGTVDLTVTVYTVTINGTAIVYDASSELPADAAELIAGIANEIATDATVGSGAPTPIVFATTDPTAPMVVLITGLVEDDYSIDASTAGGAGDFSSITADASTAEVRAYGTPGGFVKANNVGDKNNWTRIPGGFWEIDHGGLSQLARVGIYDRLYLGLSLIEGHPSDGVSVVVAPHKVMIGPSVLSAT